MGGKPRYLFTVSLLAVLLMAGACIRIPRSFHDHTYKNRVVALDREHRYVVGPLPSEWEYLPTKKDPGILFRHAVHKGRIHTQALCGASYEDLSLKMLTEHLFAGLETVRRERREEWSLSGRAALYTRVSAALDGVPVRLDVVVLKKNRCQYDFLAVTDPRYGETAFADFVPFVKGFHAP